MISESIGNYSEQEPFEYEIFSELEERQFLIKLADNFIDQVHDKEPYDSFIFLDAGARLMGNLIRERWKKRFPDEDMPETLFVKIGREMGYRTLDPSQPIHYENQPESIFDNVWDNNHKHFLDRLFFSVIITGVNIRSKFKYEKLVKKVQSSFKKLSGKKRILVIDEFSYSGATLEYAKGLFSKAFNGLEVDGASLISDNESDVNVIKPIRGSEIPYTLGDSSYVGLDLPKPLAEQKPGDIFIKPVRLNSIPKGKDFEYEREKSKATIERYTQARKEIVELASFGIEN